MPQKWNNFWSKEMGDFLDRLPDAAVHDDARKAIINSLGNLTIIGARTNSVLRNDAWKGKGGKKEFYASEGTYSETEISKNEIWDYRSILKRGEKLLDFLTEELHTEHFTREQKCKALLFRPEIYNCLDLDFLFDVE